MLFQIRSSVSFIGKVALLSLAFALFSWGLQAKLELYKSPANQKVLVAKLSTEKKSTKLEQALTQRDTSPKPTHTAAFVLHPLSPLTTPISWQLVQQVEIVLLHPGRLDLQGIYSLHRPPPSLS
jgi:hypothetical protein